MTISAPSHSSRSALIARTDAFVKHSNSWMLEQAFPFWAERTPDPAGGFFETLDLEGNPITNKPSRVRLQARMGFTFALAAELGWDRAQAEKLAARSVATLVNDCRRNDGLFGKLVQPGSGLIDDTADAYDTAFALLAFATIYRVFGMDAAREAGRELSQAIDTLLIRSDANEGGVNEVLPAPNIRDQNPHMHLTEASLAWFDATDDTAALERAERLARFVQARFYRPDIGLLVERDGVPDQKNRAEAGHMFEWVWILGEMERLGGVAPVGFAPALHSGGMRLLEGLPYFPLSQKLNGEVIEAKQRTWGPTEKLKGHIAHWRSNPSLEMAEIILNTAEAMMADHVEGALPGAWIDVVTPDKTPMIEDITPATGYHLFLALQEFGRFSKELEGVG